MNKPWSLYNSGKVSLLSSRRSCCRPPRDVLSHGEGSINSGV